MDHRFAEGMSLLIRLVLEPNVENLIEKLAKGIRNLMQADYCGIGILSDNPNLLEHFYLDHSTVSKHHADNSIPNQTLMKKIISNKNPQYFTELSDEEKFYFGLPKECQAHEFLIVPFYFKAKAIGYIYLVQENSNQSLGEEAIPLLKNLSDNMGILYENTKRYEPLKRNETLFQEFSENIPLVFWKSTLDLNTFIYLNPTYKEIWGLLETPQQKPFKWEDFIIEKDRKRVVTSFLSVSEENPYVSTEYTIQRPDGQLKEIHDTAFFIKDKEGKENSIIGVATDITEKKKMDKNLYLQNAVTKILSESENLSTALPQILKIICENLNWKIGGFWILNNKTKKLEYVLIWPKHEDGYADFEKGTQDMFFSSGEGLPGKVLNSKNPEWIEDIQNEPSFKRIKIAKEMNLHGAYATPIIADNTVVGVMEFFSERKIALDNVVLKFLENVGKQMGQFTLRKQSEEQLDYLATHDFLTGLSNRHTLTSFIRKSINLAKIKESKVAVLFLDLDRFKHINDTFGHEMGDIFLKTVGKRIAQKVRKRDCVGRLGGDEFIVVLSDIKSEEDIILVGNKMLEALSEPFMIKGHEFYITTSIGASIYPKDGKNSKTLLSKADIAMYQAKYLGGNNLQFSSAELTKIAQEKAGLEIGMHRALENEEFMILYQPKLSLSKKQITGVEALLYWNVKGNVVGPKKFLALAEETGLIIPIGEWVLKKSCEQLKHWHEMGFPLQVSVNLSSRQLLQTQLLGSIRHALESCALDPEFLELEITESMIMKSADVSIGIVNELKKMNIQIALDDFGTGYSSLMYLKRFKVDRLKIDQSFVHNIPEDKSDAMIARTIIALGHSLGLKIVAEGVETESQMNFMKRNHCDEVQGYYIAKPLTDKQMTEFLTNFRNQSLM